MSSSDPTPSTTLDWHWKSFGQLSPREIYAILAARNDVFVVEQDCAYLDIDGSDLEAWHLSAFNDEGLLACYLRVLLPDALAQDIRIGRVLTTQAFRGKGLGHIIMAKALEHIRAQWPEVGIRLHAQAHLQPFYRAFGFTPTSEVHDEDGIAHVWMRLDG
jgi:ElaA protein